jgi:hypothetical protein
MFGEFDRPIAAQIEAREISRRSAPVKRNDMTFRRPSLHLG